MEAHKDEAEKRESSHEKKGDERAPIESGKEAKAVGAARAAKKLKNNVRKLRMERMMSKAELARRAGVSTLTIDRVERGMSCRMDTKRKILEALGLKPQDRVMVFGDAEED
jgi:DNA-binding XRE family transcriptional regulator